MLVDADMVLADPEPVGLGVGLGLGVMGGEVKDAVDGGGDGGLTGGLSDCVSGGVVLSLLPVGPLLENTVV